MRTAVVLLLLSALVIAAPVPKEREKPRIELTVGPAERAGFLTITVRNNGKDSLELPYSTVPVELFQIEFRDAKGERVPFLNPSLLSSVARRASLTIAPGGTADVELRVPPGLFRRGKELSVSVRLKHDQKQYESKPLVVGE